MDCSPPPPPPSTCSSMLANHELDTINRRADLDFFTSYNRLYVDEDVNDDPYFGVKLSSNFDNIDSLAAMCAKQKECSLS
jgi:hypothetical protein